MALPDDLEWANDDTLEFGIADELEAAPAVDAPPPEPDVGSVDESEAAGSEDLSSESESASVDASVPDASIPDASIPDASIPDASIPDASVSDGGTDADSRADSAPADAAPTDALAPETSPLDEDAGDGAIADAAVSDAESSSTRDTLRAPRASRLPSGAHIAMRLHVGRLRATPYAPAIRRLLESSPDWRALLGTSGVSPFEDLEEVMLASPSWTRSRWVVAGRHRLEPDEVERAVQNLASAQGVEAPWRETRGIRQARWANPDATEREISLLSPQHFALSRPSDTPALLALAAERGLRSGDEHPADALIRTPEGAWASVEIEGARRILRLRVPRGGSEQVVPTRVQVAFEPGESRRVRVYGTLWFDSEDEARAAREFWEQQRQAYAANLLVANMGLSEPLVQLRFEVSGDQLRFETTCSQATLQLLLLLANQMMMRPRRNATGAPSSNGTPGTNRPALRGD